MKPWWKSKTVWVGLLEILAGLGDCLASWLNDQSDVPPLVGYTLLVSGLAKVLLRTLTKEPIKVPKPHAKLLTFWLGAALLMIAPAVSSGQVWYQSNCPGGVCPTGYQTRQVVRQTPIRTVAKTVTRPVSYGSTGTRVTSYGSTGSSYGRAPLMRGQPLRNLFRRFASRRAARVASRQALVYPVSTFATYSVSAAPEVQPVAESKPLEPFKCIQPTPREFVCISPTPRKFNCIKPTTPGAYDWREPRGTYRPQWIIRDGKSVWRHLIDGFPGEHLPLPADYVMSLSRDAAYMLHDTLHNQG